MNALTYAPFSLLSHRYDHYLWRESVKSPAKCAVVLLMLVSVALVLASCASTATPAPAPPPTAVVTQPIDELGQLPYGLVDHVEVAYFHLTQRCSGCMEAERLTRKTLDTYFANRLESGEMSLVVADLQDPQNAALVKKYDAWGSSLYLGIVKEGVEYTWPVIDIWFTVTDEEKFMESLRDKLHIVYTQDDM